MATRIFYVPNRVIDNNGIADGAALYVYQSGSTTPVNLFTDKALTVPTTNPYLVFAGAAVPPLYTDYVGNIRLKVVAGDIEDTDPYDPLGLGTVPGNVLSVTTKAILAATTGMVNNDLRILLESGKEGLFVFNSSNQSTNITNDPNQGVYIAPATDPTGASGAWVRKFSGPYDIRWWGYIADNATNNAIAAQAAIDAVSAFGGGELRFPSGIAKHSGLVFKNKITYRGAGRDTQSLLGTVLLYTGTGDGVQVNNPINSSTAANYSCSDIVFKNQTVNAGKGSFADTGSTDVKFKECVFSGSDRGLIFDQTELGDAEDCEFDPPAASTCGIWIVNGADRTVGATAGFTNRISVSRSQINGVSTVYGILDDGGNAHSFTDNNYNGCLNHIRAAGVTGLKVSGGELESSASACIKFDSTSLLGTAVGSCSSVYVGSGAEFVPTAGQSCINAVSLGSIVLDGVFFGNTTAVKFTGAASTNSIFAIGCTNGGGGATFSGRATNHWEVGNDGTSFAVRTNLAYSWGGTTILNSAGMLQAAGFPALTGDVTTAGGALATTLAANAVTYSKFQQVAASSLVGNATGGLANATGITLAGGLTFAGSTLTAAGALTPTSVASTGAVTSSSATAGIGYTTGAGGTVTQLTSKSTGVTLSKASGQITTSNVALAASTGVSFTVTNTVVAATDTINLNLQSGNATAGTYNYQIDKVSAGSFVIFFKNISAGSLSETLVFNFSIDKGANA